MGICQYLMNENAYFGESYESDEYDKYDQLDDIESQGVKLIKLLHEKYGISFKSLLRIRNKQFAKNAIPNVRQKYGWFTKVVSS